MYHGMLFFKVEKSIAPRTHDTYLYSILSIGLTMSEFSVSCGIICIGICEIISEITNSTFVISVLKITNCGDTKTLTKCLNTKQS
jgi:hypothetical protein